MRKVKGIRMKDINSLKEFFKQDRYIIKNGIEIVEISEKYAVCKAEITENHLNACDVVQGGMIYTIADFTFAVLANYLHERAVSQTAAITYIKAAENCRTIYAKAEELSFSTHNCIHKVTVYDQDNNILAIMQMSGFCK